MEKPAKSILVIDDDPQFRDYMLDLLEENHFRVFLADNGDSGLKKFTIHTPDLVITDIVMPDKEGVEFIHNVRMADSTVPIIAVSGGFRGDTYSYLHMAKKLGANATLGKPFTADEIFTMIDDLLA